MSSITRTIQIRASFSKRGRAEAAVAAVVGAGISPSSVDLEHGVPPETRGREGRFVWRVLVAIVLWSLAGAVPGAAFGWLLAETIGPKGTAGLVVQVVSWTIVGHLVAGMLAGYALLADRSAEGRCRPTARFRSSPFAMCRKVTCSGSGVFSRRPAR